ncbi:hypothetical protein PTTG_06703 [Puccinia triticina 1-1 BBBD Race 1]|uniref:Uncharacterized protein n=1 Tax=Puccinia triticina (isolate 1-1 / race 1 (BBBD)) TaxID=630390 RepID=A0A180G801_PUCT1|nr:hypothetical protein PTTG_06703 [Puccinia triticina 1-1 BBBD Race 1]
MSDLNIQDTSNSVKAAAQNPHPQGETSQPAHQIPPPEPGANTSTPNSSSQVPGAPPKQPKAPKAPKTTTKPVTRAATKNNPPGQQAEQEAEEPSRETLKEPDITEIIASPSVPMQSEKTMITNESGAEEEKDRETRAFLMARLIKAEKAGDKAAIDRYSKMYEAVLADKSKTKKTAVDSNIQVVFQPSVVPQKRPSAADETTQVQSVKFIVGRSNSHDDGGFTPYFHKLLLECKGPLPLTIFNREWQEKALIHHSQNRPKTDETAAEKGLRYHGLPVPDEFSQSFTDWTLNHRCFHLTMRDRYHYPVLADWILEHKNHCDRLHRKHGFMVALRYDIRIRNNAFAFRVEVDGEESFSDISKFKQETADEAISLCQDFNEISLQENPYAIGEGRVGGDPLKGIRPHKQPRPNHQNQPNPPKSKSSQKQATDETPSAPHGPASLPAKPDQGRGPPGSGYKGNNFNPNHTGGSVRHRNRDQ